MRWLLLGVLSISAAGCAPRDAGFSTVKTDVRERVGHAPRYRDVEGAEDAATTRRVQELLAKPLDAEAAVQIALLRNPKLQAAFTRLGVARAGLLGASLPPNPELHVEMGIPEEGSIHWSFEATESLTGLIALPLARAQASAALAHAQIQAAADALDVAYDARRAYYQALASEQELAIARDVVTASGLTRELIVRLHEAGNVTDLELAQGKAFEHTAQLSVTEAEQHVLETRIALWELLGGPVAPDKLRVGDQLPEVPAELPALATLEKRALDRSLDLRAIDAEARSWERRKTWASVRGIIPDLRAGVHAERDHGEWEVGPTAGIALPIFDHGQAETGEAEASMRGLAYQRQARVLSIRGSAHALRARLERAAGVVQRYSTELLPLRKQIVDQSLRQYNAMQIGVQSLLLARAAELEANRAYLAALLRYWLLRTDLDQLLAGRLVAGGQDERGATGSLGHESGAGEMSDQGGH